MSISILLADDSITIQKVIGIIFGGEDYSLAIVDNGQAAVEKAAEINPDVLLIDVLMPGMSGYEACEQIRANAALATKPILLLTGSFEPFDEEKAKSCGADAFLSKPFESQQIVAKVKELHELGLSRSSAPAFVEPATVPPPLPLQAEPSVSAPADIWGAFTPPQEQAAPVFEPATTIESPSESQIGSQWIPSDEHTFEFEEQPAVESPVGGSTDAFGEISFETPEAEPVQETFAPAVTPVEAVEPTSAFSVSSMPQILESIPEFEPSTKPDFVRSAALAVPHPGPPVDGTTLVFETPPPPVASVASDAAPVVAESDRAENAAPAATAMTEEQLRAVIASVSREVIERIVWEVVPDLAEAMIRDAIRRIREGQ
ncbi:MAG TPA: response regulator [Deltaproteobacteria bacterium]|nr:response regulator [Deltaproteobacteria bacterium]HQB38200.1 response regulator [Deltaproteobacteria bacterium]